MSGREGNIPQYKQGLNDKSSPRGRSPAGPYDAQDMWDDGMNFGNNKNSKNRNSPYGNQPNNRNSPYGQNTNPYDGQKTNPYGHVPQVNISASPNRQPNGYQTYSIHFSVNYETVVGENVCVLGSIPELGNWKTFKAHMVWTEGHIWKTVHPVVTTEPMFRYKYALLDGENDSDQTLQRWETGINRLC